MQERVIRVVGAIDTQTGEIQFSPASKMPAWIDPADLPHQPLGQARQYDIAKVTGPSLSTVRKRGASQPGWRVKNRGDPSHRLPKLLPSQIRALQKRCEDEEST
jgi:hypothetical protein